MATKRPPKKSDLLATRIPHKTKRAFLKACEEEGRSASDVIRGFIDGYLARRAMQTRLRESLKPRRRILMAMKTPYAKGGAIAASLGALSLFVLGVTPSAAQLDYRAMFDAMDADRDGRVTFEEFTTPQAPAGGGAGLMVITTTRTDSADGGLPTPERELWIPAAPPEGLDGEPGDRVVARGERRDEDGAVLKHFEMTLDDEDLASNPMFAEIVMREFGRFDANADGVVDFDEFEGRHVAMIEGTFRQLDADGDGRLTDGELGYRIAAVGDDPGVDFTIADPAGEGGFAAMDRDGDGEVSLEEFKAGPARR